MILATSAAMAVALAGALVSAPAGAAEDPGRGAVVVAVDAASAPGAKQLARTLYGDGALRPSIDEATARALVGGAVSSEASKQLTEIAELRSGAATAGSEVARRRLLAAIGAELHAALVVSVQSPPDAAPRAKILRVSDASYVGVELSALTSPALSWPNAAAAVSAVLPATKPTTAPASPSDEAAPLALAPTKPAARAMAGAPDDKPPIWKSPWFWAAIGTVAAAGATVFVLSKVGSGDDTVHLQGTVPP